MTKTVFITGSTGGIGLETAYLIAKQGHQVIIHGRSQEKIQYAQKYITDNTQHTSVNSYCADISDVNAIKELAASLIEQHTIDVLINNAGVYKTAHTKTADGLDMRFMVNTIAPYLLTKQLLPSLPDSARIINLASAAQAPVDYSALMGQKELKDDMSAYAQSKLALIMWSFHMAKTLKDQGPSIMAINPGSLLASKMVKEGFGVEGHDLSIGAKVLMKAAFSDEFSNASGQYFDNDQQCFATPNAMASIDENNAQVVNVIEKILKKI